MALEGASCSVHPDRPAAGTCARCGRFLCTAEVTFAPEDARPYCPECAARPDVDWISAHRQSLLYKRDGWTYLVGLSAVWLFAVAVPMFITGTTRSVTLGLVLLLAAANSVAFYFRQRWARPGVVGAIALFLGWHVFTAGAERLFLGLFFVPVLLALFVNTRNRLFFGLPVTHAALKTDYDRYSNNMIANHALGLSLLGWLVPLLAPSGFMLGLIALRRVNPNAKPPVGKKFTAVAAMVLGVLGTLTSTMVALAWYQQLRR